MEATQIPAQPEQTVVAPRADSGDALLDSDASLAPFQDQSQLQPSIETIAPGQQINSGQLQSATQHLEPAPVAQPEDVDMDVDDVGPGSKEDIEDAVRDNALHLTGVDNMASKDVESYIKKLYPHPFYMEWVNDTSVNIVYDDPEDAFQALVAMTAVEEFESPVPIAPTQLRRTRPVTGKFSSNQILARFAMETDVKPSDARKHSEYYKKHGVPSRKEDLVRFGTSRSAPMRYGLDGVDVILSKGEQSRGSKGARDLFPEKAPLGNIQDEDDLFYNSTRERPRQSRNRRRGGRGESSRAHEPDLFAHKLNSQGGNGAVQKSGGRQRRRNRARTDGVKSNGHNDASDANGQSSAAGESIAPPETSVYSNMDY